MAQLFLYCGGANGSKTNQKRQITGLSSTILIQYPAPLPYSPGLPLATSKTMNECKIKNQSRWKPAANKTLETGTGDARGVIMNYHT